MNDSAFVYLGFTVLPVAVTVVIAWASRSIAFASSILLWMLLAAGLARAGILHRFHSLPPSMALLLAGGLLGTIVVGRSRWIGHLLELALGMLIGFEAFRIAVELLIHRATDLLGADSSASHR